MKNKLIFPKIESFSLTVFHNEPLSHTKENAVLLIAEEKAEVILSRRLYALSKGDALLALPYSYLCPKGTDIFFGYQIHFPLDALRTLAPKLYLNSADGGTAISFSMSNSLQLLSVCETPATAPAVYTVPLLFSILEKDALPDAENTLSIPLPKILRRALVHLEEELPRKISTRELAERYEVSESTVLRLFRTHLNTTPSRYRHALQTLYQDRKNGVK